MITTRSFTVAYLIVGAGVAALLVIAAIDVVLMLNGG